MPKRRRILGPLTNNRQDSQSGFSDSKLVASPWVDQAQTNERLNHISEGQFVNWQFYNRRGNCQAASERVPGGQHFLIPDKKVQKAAGMDQRPLGASLGAILYSSPCRHPRKHWPPEEGSWVSYQDLVPVLSFVFVPPLPSLGSSPRGWSREGGKWWLRTLLSSACWGCRSPFISAWFLTPPSLQYSGAGFAVWFWFFFNIYITYSTITLLLFQVTAAE